MLKYGFEENTDYTVYRSKRATAQGNMTHYIDHALTLDTAKEIAMIDVVNLANVQDNISSK